MIEPETDAVKDSLLRLQNNWTYWPQPQQPITYPQIWQVPNTGTQPFPVGTILCSNSTNTISASNFTLKGCG